MHYGTTSFHIARRNRVYICASDSLATPRPTHSRSEIYGDVYTDRPVRYDLFNYLKLNVILACASSRTLSLARAPRFPVAGNPEHIFSLPWPPHSRQSVRLETRCSMCQFGAGSSSFDALKISRNRMCTRTCGNSRKLIAMDADWDTRRLRTHADFEYLIRGELRSTPEVATPSPGAFYRVEISEIPPRA